MRSTSESSLQHPDDRAERKRRHAYRAALLGGFCWMLVLPLTWTTNTLGFSQLSVDQVLILCTLGFSIAAVQFLFFHRAFNHGKDVDYSWLSMAAVGCHGLLAFCLFIVDAFSIWSMMLIIAGIPLLFAFLGLHFGFTFTCLAGWSAALVLKQLYDLVPIRETTVDVGTFNLFFSTWLCLTVVGALINGVQQRRKLQMVQWARAQKEVTRLLELRNLEYDIQTEALKRVNAQLHQMTMVDALTKLANRRRFDEYLKTEFARLGLSNTDLERREGTGGQLAVIIIDVDFFKLYNDSYGHVQGDECLVKVAKLIQSASNRPTDLIARYGGEEFVMVLSDTDIHGALKMAERIRDNIERAMIPHQAAPILPYVTVSLGVAEMSFSGIRTAAALLARADVALYQAKASGRNLVVCDMPDADRHQGGVVPFPAPG